MNTQSTALLTKTLNNSKDVDGLNTIPSIDEDQLFPPVKEKMSLIGSLKGFIQFILFLGVVWFSLTQIDGVYKFKSAILTPSSLLYIVVAILSIRLHTVLHELGHLFAGLWSGQKLILLSIGRWRYESRVNGFRWRRGDSVKAINGAAAMALDVNQKRRYPKRDRVIFMLGGATSNLIVGFVFFVIASVLNEYPHFYVSLNIFATVGVWIAVMNLLPYEMRGWHTDGKQVLQVLRSKDNFMSENINYLSSANLCGIRPKYWPIEKLPTVKALNTKNVPLSVLIGGYDIRLEYAIDTNQREMMKHSAYELAQLFPSIPEGIQQQIAALIAQVAIEKLKNRELYLAWRPLCEGGLFDLRGEKVLLDLLYAYECDDLESAERLLHEAKELLPEQYTTELMERRKGKLDQLELMLKEARSHLEYSECNLQDKEELYE